MSNFDDFDDFDDLAIDDSELEQIKVEKAQTAIEEGKIADVNRAEREAENQENGLKAEPQSEETPVMSQFVSEPEPEPEETPVMSQFVSEPEPEETLSMSQFVSESEPEPEETPSMSQFVSEPEPESEPKSYGFSLFNNLEPEMPQPEPEPEKPPINFSDLFAEEEEEEVSSPFAGVTMPAAMPVPPASSMHPDSTVIPQKVETADISDFIGNEDLDQAPTSFLISDTIVFNDPDKMEMFPSEWAVYTRIPQKAGCTQSPEWLSKMKKEMPSSEMLQQMLNQWIEEKSKLFDILIMPSLRESKKWKTSDILKDTQVLRELYAHSSVFWEETLAQSQGTETARWLQKVWFTKLLQYAVNYFMICMK